MRKHRSANLSLPERSIEPVLWVPISEIWYYLKDGDCKNAAPQWLPHWLYTGAKTIIAQTRSWQNCAKYSPEKYIFSPLVEFKAQAHMRAAPQCLTKPGKSVGRTLWVTNKWKNQ